MRFSLVATIVIAWVVSMSALLAIGSLVFAQEPEAAAPSAESPATGADETAKGHDDHKAGGHGHAGHDDTDLSHGNAGPNQEKVEEVRFDLALASLIIFLALLAILTKFAWGPISHGLEAREHAIAEQIENARRDSEKAAEQLRLYEQKLVAAADEARNLIGEARKEAERAREQIVTEAKAAAQHEKDRAIADIQLARQEALRAIAQRSVDTAIKLAGNIVKREIKPGDHEQLIKQALQELPSAN
jgi:F-type H+-transporting ATPase subunit b